MPVSVQGGLHLHYDLAGEGPDVLLVHGGFSRGDVEWAELLPRLNGYRAIVPDIRGHGRSDNPEPLLDRRAAGLDMARLLDELGVRGCGVIAFSMGCHLALELTRRRPELVGRLVLLGPTKELDDRTEALFRRAHPDASAEAGEPWAVALRALHPPDRWHRLMEALGDGTVGHPDWSDEDLGAISCPVLVICGDRDFYGASTRQAERVAAAIPGARFVLLPGPHAIHRSSDGGRPDQVADAITAFLGEASGGPPPPPASPGTPPALAGERRPSSGTEPPGPVAGMLVLSVQTCPRAGFRERVLAAAGAGYGGIGLRPSDLARAAREGIDPPAAAALLQAHGLAVVELEVLFDWALGGERAARSRAYEDRLYELAEAVGGQYLLVNSELEGPIELTAERFGRLCDRAAGHGLQVAIEFLPWTGIPDPQTAGRIVELAARPNGGILVDTWHLYRGGGTEEDLRQIPAGRIISIQLDDAAAAAQGTLLEDTLHRRLLPGEGSFPLGRFFAVLAEMGVRAPVCVEVISDRLAALPAAEAARLSADAARRVLDLAAPA